MVLIMNFLEQNGTLLHYGSPSGRKAQDQSGTQLIFMDPSAWCCILIFENGYSASLLQYGVSLP